MLEEELNRERSKSSQYGDGAENSITKKQLLNKDKQIESLREFIEKLEKQLEETRRELSLQRGRQDMIPQIQQLKRDLAHTARLLEGQRKAN